MHFGATAEWQPNGYAQDRVACLTTNVGASHPTDFEKALAIVFDASEVSDDSPGMTPAARG